MGGGLELNCNDRMIGNSYLLCFAGEVTFWVCIRVGSCGWIGVSIPLAIYVCTSVFSSLSARVPTWWRQTLGRRMRRPETFSIYEFQDDPHQQSAAWLEKIAAEGGPVMSFGLSVNCETRKMNPSVPDFVDYMVLRNNKQHARRH